jgi:hypothetical protein
MQDPKDPRFGQAELLDAVEGLLRWCRQLVENTPKEEDRGPAPSAPEPESTEERWYYSPDEEWFSSYPCDSREDALAEALQELSFDLGDTRAPRSKSRVRFWTGRAVPITPQEIAEHITDADSIVERIGEYFYENVGDQAPECEFTAKPEDAKELETAVAAAIAAWLTKHDIIKSHRMDKIEDHPVTACPTCDADKGDPNPNCSGCHGAGVVLEGPTP